MTKLIKTTVAVVTATLVMVGTVSVAAPLVERAPCLDDTDRDVRLLETRVFELEQELVYRLVTGKASGLTTPRLSAELRATLQLLAGLTCGDARVKKLAEARLNLAHRLKPSTMAGLLVRSRLPQVLDPTKRYEVAR
jgi:hypothetical protein